MRRPKTARSVKKLIALLGIDPVLSFKSINDLLWVPSAREADRAALRAEVIAGARAADRGDARVEDALFAKVHASLEEDLFFQDRPLW